MTDLFTPIDIGRHRLRNRIVLAPLTRSRTGEFQPGHGAPVAPWAIAAQCQTYTSKGFEDLSLPRAGVRRDPGRLRGLPD